ncbi:transcriptional regulator [Spirochaetia bacterium]|nr:transcriptional regulator [Spirochaetia bacterium]
MNIQNGKLNDAVELDVCDCDVIHQDVVDDTRAAMPENSDFYALSDLYKMFADYTRIKILWALGHSEMCVCDLAALIGMTKSAISHQLKNLRIANLVRYRKTGRVVYYSLADSHVEAILGKGMEHIHE